MPRLSILIATQGRRNAEFVELVKSLLFHINDDRVEVVAYWNNGETDIGSIRQALLEEAKGEYVCFVDDDDAVPDYYIPEILTALGKDYVGFEVELFERTKDKEEKMPRVFHSIRYGIWHQDEHGYYRGVTHLNPIRREIALKGKFGGQGLGEDEDWARTVTPFVRTETYIDKIMYYYHHDFEDTSFGTKSFRYQPYTRPVIDHPNFRYHPLSKLTNVKDPHAAHQDM